MLGGCGMVVLVGARAGVAVVVCAFDGGGLCGVDWAVGGWYCVAGGAGTAPGWGGGGS